MRQYNEEVASNNKDNLDFRRLIENVIYKPKLANIEGMLEIGILSYKYYTVISCI